MEATQTKLESRWDKFVYISSLVGLVLLGVISWYRAAILDKKLEKYKEQTHDVATYKGS